MCAALNYDPFLVGFEIEVASLNNGVLTHRQLRNKLEAECGIITETFSPKPWHRHWGVYEDGTVPYGAEISSPVNASVEDICKVLACLRKYCETNTKCGFHIHISCPTSMIALNLGRVHYWKSRHDYVNDSKVYNKYKPVYSVSPNHLEARIFNGSLATRHIFRCLRLVIDNARLCSEEVPSLCEAISQ